MRHPENKSYSAQLSHDGAMSWAKTARELDRRGYAEVKKKALTWALESELRALNYLLDEDNIDEPSVSLFSKYAATFAADLGDYQMAQRLLDEALARNPEPKMKAELLRLLADVQSDLEGA